MISPRSEGPGGAEVRLYGSGRQGTDGVRPWRSVLMAGAVVRLAYAVLALAVLWLGVGWALR